MSCFHLRGINPFHPDGEILRMFDEDWMMLGGYVCYLAKPILPGWPKRTTTNSGQEVFLGARQCLDLAKLLRKEIESGRTAKFEQLQRQENELKLYMNLDLNTNVCSDCLGKGCNSCFHTGDIVCQNLWYYKDRKKWESYTSDIASDFYEDWVKALVEFLECCGGCVTN